MAQLSDQDRRALIAANFFRAAFMDHVTPKLIYDPDSLRILDVNHAAVELYGYTRDELLAMTVLELRPPEYVEQVRAKVASKGPPRRSMAVHQTRDGRLLDVNVYSQLIDYGSGVARLVTVMHNVARENTMQESRLLLDLVLRKLPAVVWTTDRATRITRAEGAGLTAVGRGREDVLGRPLEDLFDTASEIVHCHELALQGERCVCDVSIGERVFSAALEPLRDPENEIVGVIGMAFDVTERRAAEAALRESETQLQHSQKQETVGRLASEIAHDFNNVLAVINGQAELLRFGLPPEDERMTSVEEILRATARANSLTRQLLAFSRRRAPRASTFDLRTLLSGMDRVLRPLVGRLVDLRVWADATEAPVHADPAQLEQVLLNLVVNASEAMPDGGTLSIAVDVVEANGTTASSSGRIARGAYARLSVTHTGSGIAPDVLPRIFQPFFTTKERGTGLGLPTISGIVRQCGGHICVESAVGAGTRFDVLLPIVDAAV